MGTHAHVARVTCILLPMPNATRISSFMLTAHASFRSSGTKRAATQRVVETAADARAVAPPRLPAAASPAAALPPWISAISLLDQMELRGLPPSLHTHNAAIELAALGCDVPAAVRILDRMESRGLQPDGYSWARCGS
jgi:pentatricopeptide repeat protein